MNVRKTWPLLAAVAAVGYLLLPYPLVIAAAPAAATAKDSAAPLTLSQALALALKHNPELSAFSHELRANEAAVLQAGVLPNPVLGIEADNLNNDRLRQDGDRTTAIQIGQLIELGGKRAARIRIAEAGRDLANWDYETKRIDVLSRASQHFIDTMAAQQARELAAESLKLAENIAAAVARRVQAGKVSPIEETKARLALSAAQIEAEQAQRQLAAARRNLSSMWGNAAPAFTAVAGDLENLSALPVYEQLADRIRNNPDLARWSTEITQRQAAIDAEKAKAIPDVTVSVGKRRFSQFEDHAYMVGLSIPLPLFDRNRGGILAAHRQLDRAMDEQRAAENRLLAELAQLDRAMDEQRAAENRLLAELAQNFQRLSAIRAEVATLRNDILPGARSAYEGAAKGYQLGKFGILDVLDAQRSLFQARSQHLKALGDYHRGSNDIERLIGGPLDGSTASRKP